MLGFVIVLVVVIIGYKIYKKKQEETARRRREILENAERDELTKKAESGDATAQAGLSDWYLKRMKRYGLYGDIKSTYYWRWVAFYNGHKGASDAIIHDIKRFASLLEDNNFQAKEHMLIIKNTEKDAFRDRTIYKERFPMDIGNQPEVEKMHELLDGLEC